MPHPHLDNHRDHQYAAVAAGRCARATGTSAGVPAVHEPRVEEPVSIRPGRDGRVAAAVVRASRSPVQRVYSHPLEPRPSAAEALRARVACTTCGSRRPSRRRAAIPNAPRRPDYPRTPEVGLLPPRAARRRDLLRVRPRRRRVRSSRVPRGRRLRPAPASERARRQPAGQAGLRRTLTLWDLVFYGIVLIQPVAPMGLFGVVSTRSARARRHHDPDRHGRDAADGAQLRPHGARVPQRRLGVHLRRTGAPPGTRLRDRLEHGDGLRPEPDDLHDPLQQARR